MPNLILSTMSATAKDETFEITDKNFRKVAENLEKSGYTEGITDGRTSVFQGSFDNGYEDGFRIGFLLGKAQTAKASRGNCAICSDPSLMQKPEIVVRECHRRDFESTASHRTKEGEASS